MSASLRNSSAYDPRFCKDGAWKRDDNSVKRQDVVARTCLDTLRSLSKDDAFKELRSNYKHEPWAARGRPDIGVALSGGGQRAAPFAMGVLQALSERGILAKTDLVSSVSGGGYAAYFYFTQRLKLEYLPEWERYDFFADCVFWSNTKVVSGKRILEHDCAGKERADPGPFAQQLRVACYQDIIAGRRGGEFDALEDPDFGAIGGVAVATALMLPVHHFANSLFDWELSVSASRDAYHQGIQRAYGGDVPCEPNESAATEARRQVRSIWTFDDLRNLDNRLREPCKDHRRPARECSRIPTWIITATSGNSKTLFDFATEEEPLRNIVFELTPYGFGSAAYGFKPRPERDDPNPQSDSDTSWLRPQDAQDLTLDQAVVTSAAFLDGQESVGGDPFARNLLVAGLHVANLRWGRTVANYNPDAVGLEGHWLPWPLYYMNAYARNSKSKSIYLTDGGNADNLGLTPLIARGTRNIIVVDGGHDPNGRFEDLCRIWRDLSRQGLTLGLDDIPADRLGDLCIPRGDHGDGKDVRAWTKPVWKGRITGVPAFDEEGGIRLFYIKAAIDQKRVEHELGRLNAEKRISCNADEYHYPCELLKFYEDMKNDSRRDVREQFPQHSTIEITLNSSGSLYRAYRSLGWYAASWLRPDVNGGLVVD